MRELFLAAYVLGSMIVIVCVAVIGQKRFDKRNDPNDVE